mmetsp:Transcript_12476/g.20971  ORF Transcript_12476/g.20971 Transcript_12476/m.20971 type:complete len:108 (+) Transcript_12476:1128-1451(+)
MFQDLDLHDIWTYTVPLVALLSVLAWVRNIAKFSFTFLFANILILVSATIISIYAISDIMEKGLHPDIRFINTKGIWTMLGFSFYVYEGIGILMPVMQACECPEKFN